MSEDDHLATQLFAHCGDPRLDGLVWVDKIIVERTRGYAYGAGHFQFRLQSRAIGDPRNGDVESTSPAPVDPLRGSEKRRARPTGLLKPIQLLHSIPSSAWRRR